MKFILLLFWLSLSSALWSADDSAVPLRDYMEMRLQEQDKRVEQARESSQLAISIAQTATNERLALLNEYKGLAAAREATFATREKQDAIEEALERRLGAAEETMSRRLTALEKDRERVYGAIAVVGLIGVASMVKLFWKDSEQSRGRAIGSPPAS